VEAASTQDISRKHVENDAQNKSVDVSMAEEEEEEDSDEEEEEEEAEDGKEKEEEEEQEEDEKTETPGNHDDDDTPDQNESQTEENMDTSENKPHKKRKDKTRRRASNKTLIIHLAVFAKFQNPRNAYLEPKLNDLYMKLLMHKDGAVQKAAFDCICTYKAKYLMPYKENFEKLLDDKQFKREIVLFSINEDTTLVRPEHRGELMPLLMR
jgi:hypothetical protein